jgi:hypothetical protein
MRLGAIAPGQLATLWARILFLSAGLVWFAATVDTRNATAEHVFQVDLANDESILREHTTRARAYADSVMELSRLTYDLRRAGERGPVLEANDRMIRYLQDSRKLSEQMRDNWQRVVEITRSEGRLALFRRQQRRQLMGQAAIATVVILLAGALIVTWRWFGTRASHI